MIDLDYVAAALQQLNLIAESANPPLSKKQRLSLAEQLLGPVLKRHGAKNVKVIIQRAWKKLP